MAARGDQQRPERPDQLEWIGAETIDGRPVAWIPGIKTRDLTAAETAALTDEQMARALKSRLYRAPTAETPPERTRRSAAGKEE